VIQLLCHNSVAWSTIDDHPLSSCLRSDAVIDQLANLRARYTTNQNVPPQRHHRIILSSNLALMMASWMLHV